MILIKKTRLLRRTRDEKDGIRVDAIQGLYQHYHSARRVEDMDAEAADEGRARAL